MVCAWLYLNAAGQHKSGSMMTIIKSAKEDTATAGAIRLAERISNDYYLQMLCNDPAARSRLMNIPDYTVYNSTNALITAEKTNVTVSRFELRLALASGLEKSKLYDKALQTLDQACADTPGVIIDLFKKGLLNRTRYDILKALGRYKEAIVYIDAYLINNDSLHKKEQAELAQQFRSRLEKAEYSRQLAEKEVKIARQQAIMQTLIISGAALLISSTLLFMYQRKKNEAGHRLLLARQKEQELTIANASLEAQLKERLRIAKEIHDDLGSSMTSIALITEVLKKKLGSNSPPELRRMSAATAEAVGKMNEIIWSLNTSNDTLFSLIAHIRKAGSDLLSYAHATLEFTQTNIGKDIPVSGIIRRNIYLAVKEAIHNAVKHANARRIGIDISFTGKLLTVAVQDDGIGAGPITLTRKGNGLQNMKTRMEEIGGQFNLLTGNGTIARFSVPIT